VHQSTGHRSSPIVNALSGVLTLVLLGGLGIGMWLTGGNMFSPGEVSAKTKPGVVINNYRSHADFEGDCAQCHQPLRNESQSVLCNGCHKNITEQIAKSEGTHGRMKDVEKCSSCHSEHKGHDFDPVQSALKTFNHNRTAFPLTDKHAFTKCEDCHLKDVSFGAVSKTCDGCHKEPSLHAGLFTPDCSACHGTAVWQPAKLDGQPFDHQKLTFSLAKHKVNYDNQPLSCTDCHGLPLKTMKTQTCIDCHNGHPAKNATAEKVTNPADFMTVHADTYGTDCLKCHDGADRMDGFKHEQVFALDGKHANVACEKCHANRVFQTSARACSDCHEEPKIHAGFFGIKCELCHTAAAWKPALLTKHSFPINHGEKGDVDCKTCHPGAYNTYTCYGCHEHEINKIRSEHDEVKMPAGVSLEQCTVCHATGEEAKESGD
jgi:hypothetical protein